MMISRILQNSILNQLSLKKAIILLGARQVGKTTLLKMLVENESDFIILNGDEPDIRDQLSYITSTQLKNLFGTAKTIIIDEAQLIPDIGITLKLITDNFPDLQLFVSGSSSLELANKINEPLTGRKIEHLIFPISFQEMCTHHGLLQEKRNLSHR